MEYPEAPSGYVTLYHYKEPFMPFESGYGYQGVLLFDGKSDLIQCHLCGEWMEYLPNHLMREHNMRASAYKELVGLRQSTALLNEAQRAKLIANGLERRLKNLKPRGEKTEEEKQKIRQTMKKVVRESENEKGTCPFQLIQRLQALADRLGRTPRSIEINFEGSLKRVFGTYENAIKRAGLEVRKPGQVVLHHTQYTKESLTTALHDFKKTQGRKPSRSDTRRRFIPALHIYEKHFGSWKKALEHAFPSSI